MKSMFIAVAALTLLVLGPVALGDDPEDEAPVCQIQGFDYHGVPNCQNPEFLVAGASTVLFGGSPQTGWNVNIHALSDGEVYDGVTILPQHGGVTFKLITIGPDDFSPPPLLSAPVVVKFGVYPPATIGLLRQHTDPIDSDLFLPVTLENGLEGHDVSGDVGELEVTKINTFRIGGNLGVANEHSTSLALVRGHITGGDNPGLFVGGDLLAKLVVTNEHPNHTNDDSIELLIVQGDIGLAEPTTAAEEAAGRIETANDIREIRAGAVYADVLPGFVDEDVKNINRLLTEPTQTSSGDFFGTLVAAEIETYMLVKGDFGGSITLTQPLTNPASDFDPRTITIDGGLVEGTRNPTLIALPEDGLEGQIIINRAFDGGDWEEGVVDVDGTELDAPDYATLPSAVGGGLVGLAPFDLHRAACDPEHQSTVLVQPSVSCLVECEEALACSIKACYVQHYGPVVNFGTTMPVEVSIKPTNSNDPWTDVTTEYTASIVSNGTSARLKIERVDTQSFPVEYHYRITPKPDVLRCRFVEDEPDVQDYIYYFTIELSCGLSLLLESFDLNQNETIDSGDIAAWVIEPVDFNEDDDADSADLDLLIEAVNLYGDN